MKNKKELKRGSNKAIELLVSCKCKFLLLLVLFSIRILNANAQNQNPQTHLPNVFPVNPKAFEFLKYTEVPVGKYTGVPNISVPIYTIQSSGLDIPVVLNYHSNGFRVTEEAGWTGLGWTLDAGGSVVQVVNGYDDFSTWYKNRNLEAQAMVNASNSGMPVSILSNCTNVNFKAQPNTNDLPVSASYPYSVLNFNESNSMLDGSKDMEPDVFKFSMLGYSGEFILDWSTETFKCLSDKNITVQPINYTVGNSPTGFQITTPDGNQFIFTLMEETTISGITRYGQCNPYPSSSAHIVGEKSSRVFQLAQINTNEGDAINFMYVQTGVLENLPSISQFMDINTYQTIYSWSGGGPVPISSVFPNCPASTTVNYSRQSLSYLASINFPKGKIEFNSSADRTDFIGMRKLNNIVLKDNSNNQIKSFDFQYDYFVGHSLGNNNDNYLSSANPVYNTGKIASELTNRLKLISVKESDKPAYLFEYNTETLPKKTSLAMDNWGYYNGKLNNVDMMPNISMSGIVDNSLSGIANNKNSSLTSTRAAVLNKITYPTGGASTLDYELNSFDNFQVPDDNHSTLTSIFLHDRNLSDDHPAEIFMSDVPSVLYAGDLNINTYGPLSSYTNSLSAYIRLTILKKTAANLSLVNSVSFWPLYYTTPLGSLSTQISDVVQDTRILQFNFNTATQQYETFMQLQNYSIQVDPANIYIVQAFLDPFFGPQTNGSMGANASAYFTFLKNTSHTISYGAGIRIKTIQTKDAVSIPLIKSFNYTGGKLMTPLIYLTKNAFFYENGGQFQDGTNGMTSNIVTKTSISSSSFYPMSTNASGKYIGYDQVEESNSVIDASGNIVPNSNGKIVDKYTNTPDIGVLDPTLLPSIIDPNSISPLGYLIPARKAPLQNGLSTNSKVYDVNQNLLEETSNGYSYTPDVCTYGRAIGSLGQWLTFSIGNGVPPKANPVFGIGFYPISSNKTLLSSSSKTSYSVSGAITANQNNVYDSYDQLSTRTTTDSKQNLLKTTYKYPYNYNSTDDGGIYPAMIGNNYLTNVIEQKIENNSSLLTSSKTLFSPFGGTASPLIYLPQKTINSKGTSPFEDDVIFDLYGPSGSSYKFKQLQFHDRSGVITAVVWGYGGQYPVAKVIGSTYSVISPLFDQNVLDNLLSSDLQVRNELNKIRIGLSATNALITTYTYKPLVGITSETDPRGKTKYYIYDAFNRLALIRDQDNNIVKKICYNYVGQVENCNTVTYTNDAQQATFSSTVCGAGLIAAQTNYSIAAGVYTANDKATANQLALDALNANGQAAANALPCLAPFSGWNKTSTSYLITVTNPTGTFNTTYNFYPGSSTTVLGNLPIGVYNFSVTAMYGSGSSVSMILNGTTYTGTSFSVTNFSVNAASSITIQTSTSGPCSFSLAPAFSSPTNSISNNGSTVSGYFVFYSNNTMTPGNSYLVATVNGSCRPSVVRSFSCNFGGRTWTATVYPSGQMFVQMMYGSATLTPYTTVSISPISYNL